MTKVLSVEMTLREKNLEEAKYVFAKIIIINHILLWTIDL